MVRRATRTAGGASLTASVRNASVRFLYCKPASMTKNSGTTALALVLAGTVMLLGGLLSAARSIIISTDAIDYEVRRTLSLGS